MFSWARKSCVSCWSASRAEGREEAFDYAGRLFEEGPTLTPARIRALAGDASALEACVADPRTTERLAEDVAWAAAFEPKGIPLVLVNERVGTSLRVFLEAVVLAEGSADHPAFGSLPPPRPN